LEVFHGVGDVERLAVDTGVAQRAVEHLAGGADERRVAEVLLITGLLADEHDARVRGATAEDGLRRVPEQRTALASLRRRRQPREIRACGNECRRTSALGLEAKEFLLLDALSLTPCSRGKAVESADHRIATVLEQVAPLVDDPPQDVVERAPARGVRHACGLTREVEEFRRNTEEFRRVRRRRRAWSLAPVDVARTHTVAHQRTRRGLPALERGRDLDGDHDPLPARRAAYRR